MVEKIYKYTALFFSSVFNPFVIPTIGFLIIIFSIPGIELYNPKVRNILMGIVLVSSCLLPLTFMLIMSFTSVNNNDNSQNNNKILPYIFSAFSIFLGAQLLSKLPLLDIFRLFMLGSCLILILMFLISLKWKVSSHTAGVGALLGLLLAITFKYGIDISGVIIGVILISGIIATARIYLKKHTPKQTYTSYFISLFLMYFIIYFF